MKMHFRIFFMVGVVSISFAWVMGGEKTVRAFKEVKWID